MQVRRLPAGDLPKLAGAKWREHARKPYVCNGIAYVPVKEGYPADLDLPERALYEGRGFYMVGTVAVIHGTEPTREEVAAIEAWKHPSGIVWVRSCLGRERIPDTRELGMSFWLDPAQVMFSQGNRTEKTRMLRSVQPGERVADMFAGIGYFTIPAGKAGGIVHAMEISPVAFQYLRKNIRENGLDGTVIAECGDCQDLLSGSYDRIIMGHFDAPRMLDAAFDHIRGGGTIHMHTAGRDPPAIPEEFRPSCRDGGTVRRIKKIAPHQWHYVLDMRAG